MSGIKSYCFHVFTMQHSSELVRGICISKGHVRELGTASLSSLSPTGPLTWTGNERLRGTAAYYLDRSKTLDAISTLASCTVKLLLDPPCRAQRSFPITRTQLSSQSTMSRRPEPNRAAQNQQTLKSLVKLESNKSCADCKKNKRTRVLK